MQRKSKSKLLSKYYSPEELADELDVCLKTLTRWGDDGPPVTKIGRKSFYSHSAVEAWLREREQGANNRHAGADAAAA